MNIAHSRHPRLKRQTRIRAKIKGIQNYPRLSVFRSNRHLHAQFIDDQKGIILLGLSTLHLDSSDKNKTDQARLLGEKLAQEALKQGITQAKFDRGSCRYHGRLKAFAESLRQAGLKI